ncbi:hypothetical protein ACFZB6_10470 [Streptomyces syringium]|uniref:hypothetical protein n=1 Tax=Streptomyces syringium TaxID=76729 RepID=UPI0033E72E1E
MRTPAPVRRAAVFRLPCSPLLLVLRFSKQHSDSKTEALATGAPMSRLAQASGSITLDAVRAVAETGVDAISVGVITHSAPAFDLTLLLTPTAPSGGGLPAGSARPHK